MDAICPSAPQAQAPSGILESTAQVLVPIPTAPQALTREALIKSLSDFILEFLCNARNGGDANSELFKEPHDEAVHKNSYKSRLCELISASLAH